MTRRIAIAVGCIGIAVAVWFLFFRSSDEQAVRAAVQKLADAVEVVPGENPLMRAARVKGDLSDVLAPDVSFDVPELSELSRGRDPLIGVAVQASSLWEKADIALSFGRVDLLGGAPKTAAVDATATLTASRFGGTTERDTRKVAFRLRKADDGWRITEIRVYPREGS